MTIYINKMFSKKYTNKILWVIISI